MDCAFNSTCTCTRMVVHAERDGYANNGSDPSGPRTQNRTHITNFNARIISLLTFSTMSRADSFLRRFVGYVLRFRFDKRDFFPLIEIFSFELFDDYSQSSYPEVSIQISLSQKLIRSFCLRSLLSLTFISIYIRYTYKSTRQ